MGKKRFISKAESVKFHLVHRSQTDGARANEENPSEFVLIPSSDNGNDARRRLLTEAVQGISSSSSQQDGEQQQQRRTASSSRPPTGSAKDHINELGFRNDGYDYSKHLREIDGTYMGPDGRWITPAPPRETVKPRVTFELPEESMPSRTVLSRDLEAITIDPELMDEDLRAALFSEDADEDNDFEELQDDFVAVAMQEPEVPDFDFDAHIAALIARSERNCMGDTSVAPRGWGKAGAPKGRIKRNEEIGEEEEEVEEEDSDGQFSDTIDEDEDDRGSKYTGHSHFSNYTATSAPFSLSSRRTAERRALEERRFEEALLEYEEREIGYLSDADDEEVQGNIELDGNAFFESILDDYLQEKKDEVLVRGIKVTIGARALPSEAPHSLSAEEAEAAPLSQKDIRRLVREQQIAQLESELALAEAADQHDDIRTCQEYLREMREELDWDCESVLSTYSTLDNHPALISEPGRSRFKDYKNRHARQIEADLANSADSVNGKAALVERTAGVLAPKKIELAGKLSLPVGFGLGLHGPAAQAAVRRAGKDSDGASIISALSTLGLNSRHGSASASQSGSRSRGVRFEERHQSSSITVPKPRGGALSSGLASSSLNYGTGADLQEGEDEDEVEDKEEEEEDDDGATGLTMSTLQSRKGETAEQKKARKAAVKEDRRVRRVNKKQMRDIYKDEGIKSIVAAGRKQATDNVSVFRY
jgi:protein LTV1